MAHLLEITPLGLLSRSVLAFTKLYYLIFGILSIAGGIMGFLKAKSSISLVAGSVSGALLIAASFLLQERPIVAGVLGLLVSVLLSGKFVPDFIHKKAPVPGGLMAFLSLAGIVVSILALRK